MNKKSKLNKLFDFAKQEIYDEAIINDYPEIIKDFEDGIKKLTFNNCKNMKQIRDWFHKKFGNLDIQKDLEDYQSICNIIWTWERDRKDL